MTTCLCGAQGEYNPSCSVHSEHVWNPRTQAWERVPEELLAETLIKAAELRVAAGLMRWSKDPAKDLLDRAAMLEQRYARGKERT